VLGRSPGYSSGSVADRPAPGWSACRATLGNHPQKNSRGSNEQRERESPAPQKSRWDKQIQKHTQPVPDPFTDQRLLNGLGTAPGTGAPDSTPRRKAGLICWPGPANSDSVAALFGTLPNRSGCVIHFTARYWQWVKKSGSHGSNRPPRQARSRPAARRRLGRAVPLRPPGVSSFRRPAGRHPQTQASGFEGQSQQSGGQKCLPLFFNCDERKSVTREWEPCRGHTAVASS
jgi:hypothetical protein